MRNRNIAAVRPLTDCAKTNDGSGNLFEMGGLDGPPICPPSHAIPDNGAAGEPNP